MSPRRVFKGKPDWPDQLYSVARTGDIQEDELTVFLQETEKILSTASYRLFERLGYMPPSRRLSINLKSLLDLLGNKEITDVLREGLTKQERDALIELQIKDALPRMKEIAHALLCVDERVGFLRNMGPMYKSLITKRGGYIRNGNE